MSKKDKPAVEPGHLVSGPGTVRWKIRDTVGWTLAGVRDKKAAKKAAKDDR